MDGVAIIVPVLRRPWRIGPLVQSIHDATVSPHRIVFVCSPGDDAVHAAIDEVADGWWAAPVSRIVMDDAYEGRGDYPRKINAGYAATTEPLVFTAADDLNFHPGWLEAACSMLAKGIGVVGTNDQCNRRVMRGEHSTHSLVTREYVERFGTIDQPGLVMHEGYPHEGCDDEMVQTAMARHAFAFARHSIVEHLHPDVGKAPMDEMYRAQKPRMAAGRALLAERRHLWAGPAVASGRAVTPVPPPD